MRKRRILSLFTALALCLSLLPATALAEEPGVTDPFPEQEYTGDEPAGAPAGDPGQQPLEGTGTTSEFPTDGPLSGMYKLTGNVTLTAPLSVAPGEVVTIDLNGHSINYTYATYADSQEQNFSLIDNDGTLTITDTSGGMGAVHLTVGDSVFQYANIQAVHNDGTFTLSGGALQVTSAVACTLAGVRTSAANAVTTVAGGSIQVERTSSSGTAYGIYADTAVDSSIALTGGTVTVNNSSGDTYGIRAMGESTPAGEVSLSGGSIIVKGSASTYGVQLKYSGLTMSGTDISVESTGTAPITRGVSCEQGNENRQVTGGSVTVKSNRTAHGLYGYKEAYLKVTDCTVSANSTSSTSKTYPCSYCDISSGSYTGEELQSCTVTGGSYSFDPVGFYEPYVYEATLGNDGMWTVGLYSGSEILVQNLGTGKTYASLTKAAEAASVGDTLQLQKDLELMGYTAAIGKGLTLDLNGKKISSTGNALCISGGTEANPVVITDSQANSHADAGTIAGILIQGGDVKLEKINITAENSNGTAKGIVYSSGEGSMALQGVNITVTGTSKNIPVCAVEITTSITLTAEDLNDKFPLTVSVTNNRILSSYASVVRASMGNPAIHIKGGAYSVMAKGKEAAVINVATTGSTAVISGGSFQMKAPTSKVCTTDGIATVSGGFFNFDPSTTSTLAAGYTVVTEDPTIPEGYTHAVKALPVAQVGGVEYSSLQAAIDAALAQGKAVTLIRDAVAGSTVTISGDVTIEKDGYSMSFTGSPALKLAPGVALPGAIKELDAFEATAALSDGSTAYFSTFSQAMLGYGTVKLAKDVTVSQEVTLSSSRTIDFNGFNFTSTADRAFFLRGARDRQVEVSFVNSGTEESVITGGIDITSPNYTLNLTFTLGEKVKVMDNSPLFLEGNGMDGCITAHIYGSLEVDVGSGEVAYAALQGNGQEQHGGTVVNIYEGASVDGGEESAGIFHPQKGVLNITGGTVTGGTGIYIKSGDLNISGGTVSGTGEKRKYEYDGSGFVSIGEALTVDNCGYPGGAPEVKITDGDFTSTNAAPVGSYKKSDDPDQNEGPASAVTGFIQGGTFSEKPDKTLLASGCEFSEGEDGKIEVTVTKVPVDSISLSQSSAALTTGGSVILTATVLPENATDKTVTWWSDNPAVATVDQAGKVTAVGEGTATITVKSTENPAVTATCAVTVKNAQVPVERVVLDRADLSLCWNGTNYTAQLHATVLPENATGKTVTWWSDNTAVATVDQAGKVTAVGEGVAAITAAAGGKTATCVVTVTTYFVPVHPGAGSSAYHVNVASAANGRVTVNPTAASAGATVTVTATPNEGYEVDSLTVTAANGVQQVLTPLGNNRFTFIMPTGNVTVAAVFRAKTGTAPTEPTAPAGWVNPYSDVPASAWYYGAVSYASANGLMGGVGGSIFAPAGSMNRSMVWTVVARLAGKTISGGTWAEDAQAWAVAQGVSDGTNPGGAVTREELVTMLYRYAGSPEMGVAELGLIGGYPDSGDVSSWAQDAFAWAITKGIIDGRDGKLAAGSFVTRAEAAAILARFHLLTK